MDFKNVTRLFADKDFDGEPVKVYELPPDGNMEDAIEDLDDVDETRDGDEDDDAPDQRVERPGPRRPRRKRIVVSGQPVTIIGEQVQMLGADGKPLTASLKGFARKNLLERKLHAESAQSHEPCGRRGGRFARTPGGGSRSWLELDAYSPVDEFNGGPSVAILINPAWIL